MPKNGIALPMISPKKFTRLLLKWNSDQNKREMPWKGEKDPYKIWISEIILQQTRVEQGLNYYHNFLRVFPDIHKLAKASEQKIFKQWEGLGYYTRCKNLIETARYISKERKGKFPGTYEEIRSLKGVGPYTASAIASFAFDLPYAVVDGNVFRVLARVFGKNIPVDSTEGKKYFTGLANELLDKEQPGIYNQAIMDFGAMACKPAPCCRECVFKKDCLAFLNNEVNELPVKEKKIAIRKRWFYYLQLEYKDEMLIHQRTQKDIWQQLYEFPLIEAEKELSQQKLLSQAEEKNFLKKNSYEITGSSSLLKQQLSHQLIAGRFLKIKLKQKPILRNDWFWVPKNKLKKFPFPRFINQYLEERSVEQSLF